MQLHFGLRLDTTAYLPLLKMRWAKHVVALSIAAREVLELGQSGSAMMIPPILLTYLALDFFLNYLAAFRCSFTIYYFRQKSSYRWSIYQMEEKSLSFCLFMETELHVQYLADPTFRYYHRFECQNDHFVFFMIL